MTTSPTAKQLDGWTEQLDSSRSVPPPPKIKHPRMKRAWYRRVILSTPICNAITRRLTSHPAERRRPRLHDIHENHPRFRESRGDLWLRRTEALSLAPPGLNQTATATAVSTVTPQRLCCPQQSTSDTATPAAATAAFCQNDASMSLLPQQQTASVTPQRPCCRNSSLPKGRRNVSAAATAVCEFDAVTSLLPQQQSSSVTPQRPCCRNSTEYLHQMQRSLRT